MRYEFCLFHETFMAIDLFADPLLPPFLGYHPGVIGPGGLMANMLPMPAFQFRCPILLVVLMKGDDLALQRFSFPFKKIIVAC